MPYTVAADLCYYVSDNNKTRCLEYNRFFLVLNSCDIMVTLLRVGVGIVRDLQNDFSEALRILHANATEGKLKLSPRL